MPERLTKARISLRVAVPHWRSPERFAELLEWLHAYRGTIVEVAFFTGEIHPPLPLATIEERAAQLAALIPQCRALGLTTGINHLATLGHLDEYLDFGLAEPWQRLRNFDGRETRGSFCPRDPGMRAYIAAAYRALARARPDFIWVDDDLRLGHHPPIGYPCFCDRCLAAFAAATGRAWTRPELVAACNRGPLAERLAQRRAWLAHNRRTMTEVLAHIRAAVDEVDPALPLGWMPVELWYDGFDYDGWFAALGGPHRLPGKARPGGGFYTDQTPGDMIAKAHSIGWQTALLPPDLLDVQSEHENFPYLRLRKSLHAFGTEVGVYLAAGCTGTALNPMGTTPDPLGEFRPCFDRIAAWREFYDAEVAAFGRSPCEGLWEAWSKDLFAAKGVDDWFEAPFAAGTHGALREMSELGLPLAYGREGAAAAVLGGDAPLAFSRAELLELLAGGLWLDGRALQRLHELGLGEFTGFALAPERPRDAVEIHTDDPLNGPHAGWRRDTRPSFWQVTTYTLTPLTPASRALAQVADIAGRPLGIGSGVYENRLGGRIAICGYSPWTLLPTLAKTVQLKNLARWLSRDRLPAFVGSYDRMALWCRRDAEGHLAILVLNATLDHTTAARLYRRGPGPCHALRTSGQQANLTQVGQDGAYAIWALPELAPWEMLLIRQGECR